MAVTINPATPSLSIEGLGTYTYPYTSTVSGENCPTYGADDVVCELYRNGTKVENPETIELPAGAYRYEFNTSGGQNYTSALDTGILKINKGPVNVDIYFSDGLNTVKNQKFVLGYGKELNVTACTNITKKEQILADNFKLWMDGTEVGSLLPNKCIGYLVKLSPGIYYFNSSFLGNQNYSSFVRDPWVVVTAPLYYSVKTYPTSPATYQQGITYWFNITWDTSNTTESDLDVVIIEHNFTGQLKNYTVTTFSGSLDSAEYYYTFTDLPAGTYRFRWIANDTNGGVNYTDYYLLTINKADVTPYLHIAINGSETDKAYSYGNITNVTAWSSLSGQAISYRFYRNSTLLSGFSEVTKLGAGIYEYKLNTSGNQNYTAGSIVRILTIEKAVPNLTISILPDLTVTYPTEVEIRGENCPEDGAFDVACNLYLNGSLISNPKTILLGGGTYEIKFNSTEGKNWTSASETKILVVKKHPINPLDICFNDRQNQNISIYYGDSLTIKVKSVYQDSGLISLYKNGSLLKSGANEISVTLDLEIGTYKFTANISGNQNFTSNSTGLVYWVWVKLRPDGYACSAHTQCLGGYCVHGICRSSAWYPGDGYCDSDLGESYSTSPDCPSPIIPMQPQTKVNVNVVPGKVIGFINFVLPGGKATIDIEKTPVGISRIEIEVKNRVSSVSIIINKLENKPLKVPDPVGNVYQYLSIVKSNIKDEDISKVRIRFQVEKSWMEDNNIDPSKVYLLRFSNNQWRKLPTTKVNEDKTYTYYEAESPGLSYFAIAGEEIISLPPSCPTCPKPSEWSECIGGKQTRTNYKCGPDTNYTCQSFIEERECKVVRKEVPTFSIWNIMFVIIVLVVIFSVSIFLKKLNKRRS